jgi:hypothetical protein
MAKKDFITKMNHEPELKNYNNFLESLWGPYQRLHEIAKQYRQIAEALAAGKEVNPAKIQKLAGSLDFWTEKLFNAGFSIYALPGEVLAAKCSHARAEKQKEDRKEQGLNGPFLN